jgi:hypothetical protein
MELKLKKETAKRIYPEAPAWFRELLIETFGKDCFEKKDWRDIKTYGDACEAIGVNTDPILVGELPDEKAYKQLKVIVRAVNQGWIPDWNNTNQKKWWPWFNLSSGFGFSYSGYYYDDASTHVGSRLCFETEEKSDYVANQFLHLYKEFLTLNNQ